MKVEIDLETTHALSNGDCIEINGIVGENKMEITFFIGNDPKFICCLDYKYGWDFYILNKNVKEIESGTIFTSLEYYPNSPFALSFCIISDTIMTKLNERELNITNQFSSVNDISSITISADSLIKHISFCDYYIKSTRVLQPVIYRSLKSSEEDGEGVITLMESRRRIVFKLRNNESDPLLEPEYDSDSESDLEISEQINVQKDCDYLKSLLLSTTSTDNTEFLSRYTNDTPSNKYFISYFDPDHTDSNNYKSLKTNYSKIPLEYKFLELINRNLLKTTSKINSLKWKTERIEETIEKTGREIEKCKVSTGHMTDNNIERKSKELLSVPIKKIKRLKYKGYIPENSSSFSKIPILIKESNDKKEEMNENQKVEIKAILEKKKISSHRRQKKPNWKK